MAVFWVVAPCSLVEIYRRFTGAYCLHHQDAEYYYDHQTKEYEMGGACNTHGGYEIRVKVLVGKPEGKRGLGRPGRRWEVISKCTLGKRVWRVWIKFIWLRIGTGGGFL
jgi:hypothetical protein